MAPELIEHDVGDRIALQLDDDPHAVAVRFVAQIGDALDLLLTDEFGDALDQRRLVHLIGNSVKMSASRSLRSVSISDLARMMIEPRPVE